MEAPQRDSILDPGLRRLTAGMVLVVSFIAFEAIAVATVLPVVVRHLGGIRLYGWAFSAFMLAQLVGIVVTGPLVDRIGTLRPTLVAVVLFSLGLLIDGAAPTMLVLVLGCAVQGAGAGVLVVALNVLVGRGYPPALRPRAYAAMSTAWVIPGVVGPDPADGRRLGTMWVAALVNLAFFGAEAFLPLSLTSLHHRSVTEAGVVLTAAALTWTAGSWVQARFVHRLGPRRLCAVGLGLVATGVAGVGALDWSSTPWWVGFMAWGVAGAGGAALALSVALGVGRAPGLRGLDAAAVVAALVGLCLTVTVPRSVPTGGSTHREPPAGRVVETAR